MTGHNLATVTSVIKADRVILNRKLAHLKDIEAIVGIYNLSKGTNPDTNPLLQTLKELIDDVERDLRFLPSYLLSV